MKKINLRDLFPECALDCYIEVRETDIEKYVALLTKEAADIHIEAQRAENAYLRRQFWYQAHYSLDAGDGIENEAGCTSQQPHEIFERELLREQIYAALNRLPYKQRKRIYAHFFLGMSKAEIARAEGVHKMSISNSICCALRNLRNFLRK